METRTGDVMQALSSNINICSEIYPVTDMVKEDGW